MTDVIDLPSVLDEHHAAVLNAMPATLLDLTDIPTCRSTIAEFVAQVPKPDLPEGVAVSEIMVPGHADGDPEVRVKLYRPAELAKGSPAIYWIHGGGMVLMDADGDDARCAGWADRHGCLVASVDYRLAPESPAPALIHDCYAGLTWLAANATGLGVDADRIMIGGGSAGGGLAAGLALFARDNNGPAIAAQLLVYPMLDHSNSSPSAQAIRDPRVWNHDANRLAWEAYLGGGAPTIYSSPSTCDDLTGLPPAYISCGTFDMFLDEDVDYARALLRDGVPTELHLYPGAFHGSNSFVAGHPLSVRWLEDENDFIARTLGS